MPSMRRKPASNRSSASRQAPNLQAGVRPVPSGEPCADAPTAVDASGTAPARRDSRLPSPSTVTAPWARRGNRPPPFSAMPEMNGTTASAISGAGVPAGW